MDEFNRLWFSRKCACQSAESSGKDDRQLARKYSASAFWALTAISIALAVTFLVTFHLIPWRSVFQVSTHVSTQELERACALTLALFVLGLPLNMVTSVYNAYQDGLFRICGLL
jgi:ABC-type sulfate transport system permease subunit